MAIHEGAERKKVLTREWIMNDPSVHHLTKDILKMAMEKDPLDAYYDVMLAAKVLKAEMEKALGL